MVVQGTDGGGRASDAADHEASAAATFCATLVDEWIRAGIGHAVVAPGSRSTPIALALSDRAELDLHMVIDERSAAFMALGLGLGGVPAVLVCTSGTAAVNFHPAVVEASLSEVPMIVVTADRPPELRGRGAPQTIDQVELYGTATAWFRDCPPPAFTERNQWRPLAREALEAARSGPVHLNLCFDEPLLGDVGEMPAPVAEAPDVSATTGNADTGQPLAPRPVSRTVDRERGIIIAGGGSRVDAAAIERLASLTGWPILADPLSAARQLPGAVTAFDSLLRHPGFAASHQPEVAVRIGRPPASRVVAEWLRAATCPVVQVGGPGRIDPEGLVVAEHRIDDLLAHDWRRHDQTNGDDWAESWRRAELIAQEAMAKLWATEDHLTEPRVARLVADAIGRQRSETGRPQALMVASSMPIRDLEWFGGPSALALANRGANGIDGTISTAVGRAMAGTPMTVLVGDLAFLHDSNALIGLVARSALFALDLRIIVIDNDGGGIFSFLPQAARLDTERFEELFGTPHHSDLVALGRAHGIDVTPIETVEQLGSALAEPPIGVSMLLIGSDRSTNVDAHRLLHQAVADAIDMGPDY